MKLTQFPTIIILVMTLAQTVIAADCPVREIGATATASGTLASTDCKYRDIVSGSTKSASVHQYQVTIETRGVLTVEMHSAEFNTYLYLFGPGYESWAANDNISRTNTDSSILISLKPGKYIFFASATSAAQTGAYSLKTSFQVSPGCPVVEITPGESVSAELTNDDCRFLDIEAPSTDVSRVKQYSFKVAETGVVTVEMQSAAFGTYLDLLDESRTELTYAEPPDGSNDSRIVVSLKPGTNILYASTIDYGIGPFTLSTKVEPLRTCAAKAIGTDETLSGDLTESTCRYLDLDVPSDDDTLVDPYALTVKAPALVTLDMKSKDLDTYLVLLDANGKVLANDDDGGGGTDSRISISLNPGVYTIFANTSVYGTGAYTLAAASEKLRACAGQDLPSDKTISGNIQADSCRVLDIVVPSRNRNAADRYNVTLERRGVLNLEGASAAFPLALGVFDSGFKLLNSMNGTAQAPGVNFGLLLNRGAYAVLVSPVGSKTGAYTLKGGVQDPPNCVLETLDVNATQTGAFSASNCRVKDMLAGSLAANPARQYQLRIDAPGTLTLTISSPDALVGMLLLNGNDEILNLTAGNATPAKLSGSIESGDYRVLLMPVDVTTGKFTLQSEFVAAAK
jgi:hypothetical protein